MITFNLALALQIYSLIGAVVVLVTRFNLGKGSVFSWFCIFWLWPIWVGLFFLSWLSQSVIPSIERFEI